MKNFHRQKLFPVVAKWLCVLLAVLALPVNVFAQPKSPERWLFIFDLSPTMKKRLPATEAALKNFFASAAEGRLQDGDNIGVWTYDQKTHGGQFPLVIWKPEQATELTSNLTVFLQSRAYTASSQLAALQPSLTGVITNSERLTIVIFCDGESDIAATPYDAGINQSFLDGRAERKKNSQPFVVLIRTLSRKFIGCTVNFPPGAINIPLFLAPAAPMNIPSPPPVVIVPVKPPPPVPDLVIVGTQVSGGTNSAPKISSPASNEDSIAAPKIITAPAPPPTAIQPVVNHAAPPPMIKVEVPLATPATNIVAANANNDADGMTRRQVLIGGGLLAAVIVLVVILLVRRSRRPHSSLITSSMQDDPRRK
ncbi:MAG TPA: hypothetical protein VIK62_04800 [Verrucomicrobiae bacterium]